MQLVVVVGRQLACLMATATYEPGTPGRSSMRDDHASGEEPMLSALVRGKLQAILITLTRDCSRIGMVQLAFPWHLREVL